MIDSIVKILGVDFGEQIGEKIGGRIQEILGRAIFGQTSSPEWLPQFRVLGKLGNWGPKIGERFGGGGGHARIDVHTSSVMYSVRVMYS